MACPPSFPDDDLERLLEAWSVLHDLPASRTQSPSAASGAALCGDTVRHYAHRAGFTDVEVFDFDNDFWHFYSLRP